MAADLVIEIIYDMLELTHADITLVFSVNRVLKLCRTLTELCIFHLLLATAYENLIKHLRLAIRQLEVSKTRNVRSGRHNQCPTARLDSMSTTVRRCW